MISVLDPNLPNVLLAESANGIGDRRRVRIVGIGGSTRMGSKCSDYAQDRPADGG